jgi:hypothetical protein
MLLDGPIKWWGLVVTLFKKGDKGRDAEGSRRVLRSYTMRMTGYPLSGDFEDML